MEAQSPTFARTKAGLALTSLVLCGLAPWPSQAEDLNSLSIGVRASVAQGRVLGDEQPEAFREYDVFASIRLPWERYNPSGWGVGTRLLASAGVLQGGRTTRSFFLSSLFLPLVVKMGALCSI